MSKSIQFFVTILAFVAVYSCSQNEKKSDAVQVEHEYVDERVSEDMQRTITDTVAVLSHVRAYLDLLHRNEVDSAMTTLYVEDGDSVAPLSGARLESMRQQVTRFPVLKYTIDKMQMFNSQDTRVHYTIEYFEKPEDSPMQNTLQCVIGLRRVGYKWYLIVPDESRERIEDAI